MRGSVGLRRLNVAWVAGTLVFGVERLFPLLRPATANA
jgi:hypothetical protein